MRRTISNYILIAKSSRLQTQDLYLKILTFRMSVCTRSVSPALLKLATRSLSCSPRVTHHVTSRVAQQHRVTSQQRALLSSTNSSEILDTVARNIETPDADKFAVIYVKGKQFKVGLKSNQFTVSYFVVQLLILF